MFSQGFRFRLGSLGLLLPLLALLTACGPASPKTVAARGSLKTKDGRPCVGALVVFHPQEKERINDPKPVATTDGSGSFVLTTFASEDGAVPGDYGVTVVWPGESKATEFSLSGEGGGTGVDQLGGRYGDPRQPLLRFTVPKDGSSDITLEVEG